MTQLVKDDSEVARLHINTPLMGESLVSKEFLRRTESQEYFRMQPEINILRLADRASSTGGPRPSCRSWTN